MLIALIVLPLSNCIAVKQKPTSIKRRTGLFEKVQRGGKTTEAWLTHANKSFSHFRRGCESGGMWVR